MQIFQNFSSACVILIFHSKLVNSDDILKI